MDTGITGATDIEVLGGLKEGDEIMTGTYKVMRTFATRPQVKVDNKTPEARRKVRRERERDSLSDASSSSDHVKTRQGR